MLRNRISTALLALALGGCASPEPPVWLVPADRPMAPDDLTGAAITALRSMGWSVLHVDRSLGAVETDWDYAAEIKGNTRRRALIRVPMDVEDAVAVSVPVEYYDGTSWCPNGEDEEKRKYLIASLRARLTTPPMR